MKFVIFHGSFGSFDGNWFPFLKNQLELLNQQVLVPQFPVEEYEKITKLGEKKARAKIQNLSNWLLYFQKNVYKDMKNDKKLVFIGHSLAPVFILHLVDKFNIKLDCAIFVSPFLKLSKDIWQLDLVNKSFYKIDFDFEKSKKLIPTSYALYSDDDPYVKTKYSLDFAEKLGSSTILVKGGKHFNAENKFFSFPLVFELCKTRLDAVDYL